jgi:hypothetical protein
MDGKACIVFIQDIHICVFIYHSPMKLSLSLSYLKTSKNYLKYHKISKVSTKDGNPGKNLGEKETMCSFQFFNAFTHQAQTVLTYATCFKSSRSAA